MLNEQLQVLGTELLEHSPQKLDLLVFRPIVAEGNIFPEGFNCDPARPFHKGSQFLRCEFLQVFQVDDFPESFKKGLGLWSNAAHHRL